MKLVKIVTFTNMCRLAFASIGIFGDDHDTKLLGSFFGIPGANASFDYVIVGGGTSGLTVANRLAARSDVSVAVVEGGSFYEISNGNVSQIPAYDFLNTSADPTDIQPLIDWGIVTLAQQQLDNRRIFYAQGKCLGGSSARNYLAYQRGTTGSYQQWADTVADQSFTFANLLPFFKRSIKFTTPNYAKREIGGTVSYDSDAFSTSGGPVQVSYPNFWQPMATYVIKAFNTLGLVPIHGFNSGNLSGYAEFTTTTDPLAETRSSSETSFLQDSLRHSSPIQIFQQTLARQIVFDSDRTAVGVKVSTAEVPYFLYARREVIVAAGAIRTPQLLMLSGLGPAPILENFKIPVIANITGVGQNMWDQPYFGLTYRVNVLTQSTLLSNSTYAAAATEDYLTNQKGPLTVGGGSIVGFEKLPPSLRVNLSTQTASELANFPPDWPEIELLPLGGAAAPTNDSDNYFSINLGILTTTSRGNITLSSIDPNDNPIVSPNWLLTRTDQELAVQAVKRARQVASSTGIVLGQEIFPGPSIQSDGDILDFIRQNAVSLHHAAATCAMGSSNDSNAVVDTHGRVLGVGGVRIVDASAFALLPPGHPQATVYMLAEKLASDIINDGGF